MTRLPPQPTELISRDKLLRFTFDGKPVEAYEGDTVGSALFAAGRRTFSRSFKYHRRRGLMCCSGNCPNCIVAVDGAPGARACVEPVREGMRVEHVNARPGLEFDLMRATDLAGNLLTPFGKSDVVEVDNAYAVPAATSCGAVARTTVTRIINEQLGLPSPAGTNTTQLTNDIYIRYL